MLIDPNKCIKCRQCVPYCPVDAITVKDDAVEIDFDECVECSNCLRWAECPTDAIYQQELNWPRTVRAVFSNVLKTGQTTGLPGRGTEEMKTNDVTGKFRKGEVGIALEFGRPILGARLYDVEKVALAVASIGVEFEKFNPVINLMEDHKTGKFKEELLNEKVLSLILEFKLKPTRIPELFRCLKKMSQEIETVFSFDLITRINPDGSIPTDPFVKEAGVWIAPNGKTCLGFGRPLYKEERE